MVASDSTLIQPLSGAIAIQITNIAAGSLSMSFGGSSGLAGSSGLLFYSQSQIFDPIQGDFSVYFVADSAAGDIAVVDYI